MNKDEYETYCDEGRTEPPVNTIDVSEVPGEDRTLVYGYTLQRNTFHVYKADGELHVVIYDHNRAKVWEESGTSIQAERMAPNKRAYPERCDLAFARLMRERECPLTFTNFGGAGSKSEGTFAGLLIHETK